MVVANGNIASYVQREIDTQALSTELCKRSFYYFVQSAWHVIEPGTTFVDGKHIEALCLHLQAVAEGRIQKLLINMPPRHCKSTIVSVLYPVWVWIRTPEHKFLCASYAMSLAIRDNLRSRRLIQSPWFRKRFGTAFILAGDQNVKGRYENDHAGYRIATSVGASATGEGGDTLIIDDPHNIDENASEARRETALTWFREVWTGRLNNKMTGSMIVVGQRIHEQDVSATILSDGGWEHLNLSAEYDPSSTCSTSIWQDWRHAEGELLWSERFPLRILEQTRATIGALAYSAQYQQRPVPPGGYIFKQKDERFFTQDEYFYFLHTPSGRKPVAKSDCWLYAPMDLAISEKKTADYTVIAVWAITPQRDILLVHLLRARLGHSDTEEKAKQVYHDYVPEYFHIEHVGYQSAVTQDLLVEGIPCRAFDPKPWGDKVARAGAAAIWQLNGKMYFLKDAAWLPEYQKELYTFPKCAHDDQVDVSSMAAIVVRPHGPLSQDDGEIPTQEEAIAEEREQTADKLNPFIEVPLPDPTTINPFAWIEAHGGWE